jgi:predicted transcriptional regulator
MPYAPFLAAARELRHDVDALAARFGVSFEQAAHRLSTLQREGARGVPFFFLRLDPAGNVTKRFSAAGFPFARFGGNCPKWVVHHAFATPGQVRVQVAELEDGAAFLCFARAMHGATPRWGEPAPMQVVAMGCDVTAPPRSPTATGWTSPRRASASACPAGSASGPTAARAPSRRWSTACGWTPTRTARHPGASTRQERR